MVSDVALEFIASPAVVAFHFLPTLIPHLCCQYRYKLSGAGDTIQSTRDCSTIYNKAAYNLLNLIGF